MINVKLFINLEMEYKIKEQGIKVIFQLDMMK